MPARNRQRTAPNTLTSITQKASARSRQEHKTTISTTTVTGTAETSTRILKNSSTTDPIRIDYFSLMRKWRVRLYRFGLRLTYDLVMPEPGAAMRRAYMELDALRKQIGPFRIQRQTHDLTTTREQGHRETSRARRHDDDPEVSMVCRPSRDIGPALPSDPSPITATPRATGIREWVKFQLEFDVPSGTAIKQIFLDLQHQLGSEREQ